MQAKSSSTHETPVKAADSVVASGAFERAALQREKTRIIWILVVLSTTFLFLAGRSLLFGGSDTKSLIFFGVALLAGMISYESVMLIVIGKCTLRRQMPSNRFWTLNSDNS